MTGLATLWSHQSAATLTSRIIGSSGRPSNQQRGPRAQPRWHPSRGPASLARSPRRSPPPVCRPAMPRPQVKMIWAPADRS